MPPCPWSRSGGSKQMKVLMETEQFVSKYGLRCKALDSAWAYLHKSMAGAKHLNAVRAANFIERLEAWLDQNAPVPVTPWTAAAPHFDYSSSGDGGMKFKENRPLSDVEAAQDRPHSNREDQLAVPSRTEGLAGGIQDRS